MASAAEQPVPAERQGPNQPQGDGLLQRVERLEQENRILRSEIAKVKVTRQSLPLPHILGGLALAVIALLVGAAAALMFANKHIRPRPPAAEVPLVPPPVSGPPVPPPVSGPPAPGTVTQPPGALCNPPYFYDDKANKVFKKECL